MTKASKELSDRITVMVFKDNFAARTFQVPHAWLNRFGLLLLLFGVVTLSSAILAAKYYNVSRRADLSRVRQLESEISDLQAALQQADARHGQQVADNPAAAPQSATDAAKPAVDPLADLPTASPIPAGDLRPITAPQRPYVFAALPPEVTALTAPPPIVIGSPKAVWQGKNLDVSFNIQYQRGDRGNQQGRIIILARGPDTLMAYPQGVIAEGGKDSLLQPERGEYFSVSRFRAVKAQFGPMRGTDQLKEIEILLVSDAGQVILYDRLPVSAVAAKKPVTDAASSPVSSPSGAPAAQGVR